MSRRSSIPGIPIPPGQVHATRRSASRKDATERIRLRREAFETSGWTLNISRGGARLVLEEPVELGQKYQVELGVDTEPREVRIIWAQDEADGQIVGVQFLDIDGSIPPPPGNRTSSAPPGSTGSPLPRRTSIPPKSSVPAPSSGAPQTEPKRPKTEKE